jgi:hypothetical protein
MCTDTKYLKWFHLFPLPSMFFTSSGNYIPAFSLRFEAIINMTIRDRTIWNWYYTSSFYQMKRYYYYYFYYYLNTTAQIILLFLWRGIIPTAAMHVELPLFFLWRNCILNSTGSWASASELIKNGLMTRIIPWTLSFQFKILHGLEKKMCVWI